MAPDLKPDKRPRASWPRSLAGVLLAAQVLSSAPAGAEDAFAHFRSLPKEKKVLYTNLGVAGFIAAYGIANWDYGGRWPSQRSEGWFGRDTREGGVDKLGHLYGTYALSHALSSLYRSWGFQEDDAGLVGALSALGLQTFMELGDSFTSYGFAYEDVVMNAAGAAAGYLLWRHPTLRRKLDLRIEYRPAFDNADVFTDYEHQKYLLALRLDGFDAVPPGPLRYLELHLGYYARGYSDGAPENDERNVYVGIGINLSRIAREHGLSRTSTILRYVQPPATYLSAERDLNR